MGKTSIHFSAEATNSELVLKIVFSANQLSIYGAVSNWCYQYEARGKEQPKTGYVSQKKTNQGMIDGVNSVDLRSLMSTPRSTNAAGNKSSNFEKINDMSLHGQISILCDLVSLTEVEINDYFVTRQNIDDGWRGIDTQCKEYTFSRSDPNSRNYCKIPGETKIGPVKDVRVVKIAEIHGTEIEVPSVQNRSDTSWVVITRGRNRFFDELDDSHVNPHVTSSTVLQHQANSKEADASEKEYESFGKPHTN